MRLNLKYYHICNWSSKQNADSAYILWIPLTVADSAKAQFLFSYVLLFVCGYHKLFRISQILLQILQNHLLFSEFEGNSVLAFCLWDPKQQRRSNNMQSCGFRHKPDFGLLRNPLALTKCIVWPRNN